MTRSKKPTDKPPKAEPDTVIAQARLPRDLYKRIQRCADAELITTAAYIRRLLNTHVPGGV